jgi:glycosyltransferase involved in cell wall biosynthesis
MTKGILYYTDNQVNMRMAHVCRKLIKASGLPIVSATLKPTDFGTNVHIDRERGYETMFTQILEGLKATKEDIIFFCEHDTMYHPSHFEFTPPEKDKFYYAGNYWYLRLTDGFSISYNVSPLSGLVAYREPLIKHFEERLEYIKEHGFSYKIGFEPFTHGRIKWKTWYDFEIFMSEYPNVDLCHGGNVTKKRWKIEEFRRKPTFWKESDIDNIPGWPNLKELVSPFYPQSTDGARVPPKEVKSKKDDSLSILIPGKNEEFMGKTVENILENIEGNTNIIVVLDGYETPIPDIPEDPRVTIIKNNESKGQREATNQACRLSTAKYVAKTDAHCAFDKGFDKILMDDMQDDWTMVPVMRNLWAFDWKCPNGHTRYQSPSGPCEECGEPTEKDIKWIGKNNPQSTAYLFDNEPHFQYFGEYKKRDEYKKAKKENSLTDSMSLQGSFFMMTRDKYWELNVSDGDTFGSWGSQGIEVACKTWLSGGRVVCNHKTWYAHMFRTQGGDFGFPYKQSGKKVSKAKKTAKEIFFDNKWDKQVRPLSWLLEKFWPVPGWNEDELKKLQEWAKLKEWPSEYN